MQNSLQKFEPKIGERINLFGSAYVMQAHPAAPEFLYVAGGRKAKVYQLQDERRNLWALKVFRKQFQTPDLVDSVNRLERLKTGPGLFAANRTIVGADDPLVQEYPDLKYAILMPWLNGTTWADALLSAYKKSLNLPVEDAKELCLSFLEIMYSLEKQGYAHTDISPGNVIVTHSTNLVDVQLLDLEDMYQPGIPVPAKKNAGTDGYRHSSQVSCFCPEGDRYASAILSAELLILSKPELAYLSTPDGYFIGDKTDTDRQSRFDQAYFWLNEIAPHYTTEFVTAWKAPRLSECPPLAVLYNTIRRDGVNPIKSRRTARSVTINGPRIPQVPSAVSHAVVHWESLTPATYEPQAKAPETTPTAVVQAVQPQAQPEVKHKLLKSVLYTTCIILAIILFVSFLAFLSIYYK